MQTSRLPDCGMCPVPTVDILGFPFSRLTEQECVEHILSGLSKRPRDLDNLFGGLAWTEDDFGDALTQSPMRIDARMLRIDEIRPRKLLFGRVDLDAPGAEILEQLAKRR